MNNERTNADRNYEDALAAFRGASRDYTAVVTAYRARTIDDAVYLAGRKAFNAAQAAFDLAENTYIDAKNAEEDNAPGIVDPQLSLF